jgi:uncharacterized Tic20 family protein
MNMTDELERLHQLHQTGALTAEEFAQAKQSLLSGRPFAGAESRAQSNPYSAPQAPTMSQPPDSGMQEHETRQWALMLHISALAGCLIPFGNFAAVLLIWQLKKHQLPGLEPHGRTAMNWAISQIIYYLIAGVLAFALFGFPLLIVVYVLGIIFPIVAAVKANNGELWKYPLSIEFLK